MTRNRPKERTLRIIGGNWRSRKVSFPPVPGIRPSPDRVRETLFNWLQFDIAGARCLELFAGSGILSLEALSRGAGHATIIDRDADACDGIRRSLKALNADETCWTVLQSDAAGYLHSTDATFDIVFLDPPFDGTELDNMLPQIAGHLSETSLVYIESGRAVTAGQLPASWRIHRQKRAGQVHFALCCLE